MPHDTDNTLSYAQEFTFIRGKEPLTIDFLLAKKFPDNEWLIDGLIPTKGLTILSAQPSSYKTWLLLEIAKHVAAGTKLFDQFNTRKMGVLLIDEENGDRLIQKRLRLLGAEPHLPIHLLTDVNFKLEPDAITEVIDYCKAFDIGLITFDSLVRIHTANENDARDMSQVFEKLRAFVEEDLTVIITHHNRKGSSDNAAQAMRGSSDILAALDCHLALKRTAKRNLELEQAKLRLAEEIDPIELKIETDPESFKFIYTGSRLPNKTKQEVISDAVLELLISDIKINQKQILEALEGVGISTNAKTLRIVLERLTANGDITQEQGIKNEILYSGNEKDE